MSPQAAQELLLGLAEEALSGPDRGGGVPGGARMAAAPRVAAPRAGRTQHLHPARRRAVRHRRAADPWKTSSSRTRRPKARRGCPASWPRAASAPTPRCSTRSCAAARTTRASTPRRAGCGWTRPPPSGTSLTSARTVEVITGPAGTGKTRVLATAARAWDGPVFGTATSQNATNELRAAGVRVAANTTRLLADIAAGPDPARLADRGRRRLHDLHHPPGRARRVRGPQRLQAGAGRGPGTARRRRRRRRHDAARRPARLRPARRTGPVHRRLGTRRLPAAAPGRRHRAGRVRPARPHPRRPARPGHGPGRPRLRGQLPGRPGRPADGRGLGPLPGTVRPDPRRPDPPRPGRRRPDDPDRRRRRGLGRGPDHLPPQRPRHRGGRARPDPGQRRHPADRGHHPPRHHGPPPARPRPGHRAAPVHRPGLPLHRLPVRRPGLRDHRALRPGRHRAHRDRAGHRHRRPAVAVPGDDPRHRRQPRVRLHHPGPARRPAARHPPRPRTRPLRPHPPRTRRIPASTDSSRAAGPGGPARADRRARRRPQPRRRRAVRLRDPAAQPGQRRPPGHPPRDLDRRNHSRPPRPLPRPGHGRASARPPAAALAPGPVAVPHPARRRTRRPGPRRGHRHRHRLPRPGRSPRHRRRPGRPDPPARPSAAPPAARPLGRTGTPTCPTPTATPTWPRSPP